MKITTHAFPIREEFSGWLFDSVQLGWEGELSPVQAG